MREMRQANAEAGEVVLEFSTRLPPYVADGITHGDLRTVQVGEEIFSVLEWSEDGKRCLALHDGGAHGLKAEHGKHPLGGVVCAECLQVELDRTRELLGILREALDHVEKAKLDSGQLKFVLDKYDDAAEGS